MQGSLRELHTAQTGEGASDSNTQRCRDRRAPPSSETGHVKWGESTKVRAFTPGTPSLRSSSMPDWSWRGSWSWPHVRAGGQDHAALPTVLAEDSSIDDVEVTLASGLFVTFGRKARRGDDVDPTETGRAELAGTNPVWRTKVTRQRSVEPVSTISAGTTSPSTMMGSEITLASHCSQRLSLDLVAGEPGTRTPVSRASILAFGCELWPPLDHQGIDQPLAPEAVDQESPRFVRASRRWVLLHPSILWHAAAAFGIFCIAAFGTLTCLNDAIDVEADRLHPTKRLRPIAAGIVRRLGVRNGRCPADWIDRRS